MIRHVVVLTFQEDTTDEQLQAVLDGLGTLPNLIPEIRSYSVGVDAGLAEGNGSLAVVADFDDPAGHAAYTTNADHQRVIAETIRPILAGRAAVQYVVP